MAQATNTTPGEIVLSGDLAGGADGTFPELRASGVTPGSYAIVQRITFDTKGRAVSVGQIDYSSEVYPLLSVATDTQKGIFSIGNGLTTSAGSIYANVTSGTTKGVFSISNNLQISSSKVYTNFSTFITSTSSFGFVKSGTNVINTAGVISLANATSSVKGVFSVGSGLLASGGSATVDYTQLVPAVQLKFATSSVKGVFSVGSGLLASGGVISAPKIAMQNRVNTFTVAQNQSISSSTGTTFTPNFQTGSAVTDIVLSGNLAIQFPSTLAPAGTVVTQVIVIHYDPVTAYTVNIDASYAINKATLFFTNSANTAMDVLTLICTDTICYAVLNKSFM